MSPHPTGRLGRIFLREIALAVGCLVLACGLARATELPPLLQEALANGRDTDGHWAYTETTEIYAKSGKKGTRQLTIVRYDPSKPYAEQYTPLKVKGRPPTSDDLADYREKGEDRQRKREKAAHDREEAIKAGKAAKPPSFSDRLDVDHITVETETPTDVVYRVPIRKGQRAGGLPIDRFDLFIRVGKERRQIENFVLRVREAIRMKLIANIKGGEITIDFKQVDPRYAPVMAGFQGNLDVRMFFAKFDTEMNRTRSDFQRVTPYDDRFKVEIGPLKALDF